MYHYYQVVNSKKPEEQPMMNERLLFWAYFVYDSYTGLRDLLTKPPVPSLLLERPPLPPGYMTPKTLVLNVSGTLVHSEYKVSADFYCFDNCYSFTSLALALKLSKDLDLVCSFRDWDVTSKLCFLETKRSNLLRRLPWLWIQIS